MENQPKWNDTDWLSIKENQPKDEEEVYLKCEYMFMQYVTLGKMTNGGTARHSSNEDPDLFFRSTILGWKAK